MQIKQIDKYTYNKNMHSNFGIKFELTHESKEIIERKMGMSIKELQNRPISDFFHPSKKVSGLKQHLKQVLGFNHQQHVYLVPRNIYLETGRVMSVAEAEKIIINFSQKPLLERVSDWIKTYTKKLKNKNF